MRFIYVVNIGPPQGRSWPVSAHYTLPGAKVYCKKEYGVSPKKIPESGMIMRWHAGHDTFALWIHRLPVRD